VAESSVSYGAQGDVLSVIVTPRMQCPPGWFHMFRPNEILRFPMHLPTHFLDTDILADGP